MANNRINRYIGAMALGTVLMAVPGCTDTWDDHYNTSESASGTTQTLWDIINDSEKHPEFSRFRDIVQHAKYYKDNTHAVSTYSYADILGGGQVNTVWIPDNSALSEAEYQKWMSMLAESRADESGNSNAGFNVQQQFLGNHIALWRHNISEPGIDTVKMINGKNLIFDKGARTLEGIPLGEDCNIATANGVMHVLKGVAPFRYNLYEHLKYGKPGMQLSQYVISQDTTYFSTDRSIEGLPDENGNPTYVDSVYYTTNLLFRGTKLLLEQGGERWQMAKSGFGADISSEDSSFIMLVPTDAAWDAIYNKLLDSHIYGTNYEDKTKGDEGAQASAIAVKVDPDSLQRISTKMDIIAPLVFNVNKQPKTADGRMWTLEKFAQLKGEGASYLLNTFGDTLRAIGGWNPSSLFNAEPIEMSNGLAYEVGSWAFPKEYYTPDVEVEIENSGNFYNIIEGKGNTYKVGPNSRRYTFSNELYKDITKIYGEVSNNNFYHLAPPSASAGPKVEIKLEGNSASAYVPNAQVMSGKYDIQIVFVPYWYLAIAGESEIDDVFYKFVTDTLTNDTIVDGIEFTDTTYVRTKAGIDTEMLETISKLYQYSFKVSLTYNNNGKTDKKNQVLLAKGIYNGQRVDTLTVAEEFEFPVSYKNMLYSYPTLTLEWVKPSKAPAGEDYVFDLIIDKIILKRKN